MQKISTSHKHYHQDAPNGSIHVNPTQDTTQTQGGKSYDWLSRQIRSLISPTIPDELYSRIIDGTLPALTLLALTLMIDLLIYPIQATANIEGLFIYFFIILACGLYSLDRSTTPRRIETSRALWGMAAGLFLWHAIWMVQLFVDFSFESPGPLMILLMVSMVGMILWKPVLPLGVKFFLVSFLASWYSRILVIQLHDLSASGVVPPALFYLTGFLALVGALCCIGYLVYRAEFRVQRFWAALVLWQVSLVGLSVATGALF